jgi:predicted ester cyclase
MTATANMVESTAKATVLSYIDSLNNEDFDAARELVTDDMTFTGVLGTREGAEAYMQDMRKMKMKYDIKKAFADGDDVSLFYDIALGGITFFSAGWYKVENDKIKSFRVVFDPRPLLEGPTKK